MDAPAAARRSGRPSIRTNRYVDKAPSTPVRARPAAAGSKRKKSARQPTSPSSPLKVYPRMNDNDKCAEQCLFAEMSYQLRCMERESMGAARCESVHGGRADDQEEEEPPFWEFRGFPDESDKDSIGSGGPIELGLYTPDPELMRLRMLNQLVSVEEIVDSHIGGLKPMAQGIDYFSWLEWQCEGGVYTTTATSTATPSSSSSSSTPPAQPARHAVWLVSDTESSGGDDMEDADDDSSAESVKQGNKMKDLLRQHGYIY